MRKSWQKSSDPAAAFAGRVAIFNRALFIFTILPSLIAGASGQNIATADDAGQTLASGPSANVPQSLPARSGERLTVTPESGDTFWLTQARASSTSTNSLIDLRPYGSRPSPDDENLRPACDSCPKRGLVTFVGYDSFRGVSDDSWQNNGIHTGLNYGTRLGRFSDLTGIGFQIGGSVGVYDWAGTDYRLSRQKDAETQGFVTWGFFRKANERSNWSAALVKDWMINDNFGVFAESPTLSQWRGQWGYATSACNEYGIWGAWRGRGDTRQVPSVGSTSWRAVNQMNLYWHHKWGLGGPDTSLWVGVPEHDRFGQNGSLGDYLAGASANVPLSKRTGLYTLVTYMHPSARPGPAASEQEAWNFTIGVSFYPGGNARSNTVAGQCWMPQLPVANNGYFLVDTNR